MKEIDHTKRLDFDDIRKQGLALSNVLTYCGWLTPFVF